MHVPDANYRVCDATLSPDLVGVEEEGCSVLCCVVVFVLLLVYCCRCLVIAFMLMAGVVTS